MKNHTAEFIEKFDASRDPALWVKLMEEEVKEAEEAAAELLKELVDCLYVANGFNTVCPAPGEIPEDLKPRVSAVGHRVIRLGRMIEASFGRVFNEAHDRVHASNLSKLDDAGRPIRREDGKVLKGPNYKPPYLLDLITGESLSV